MRPSRLRLPFAVVTALLALSACASPATADRTPTARERRFTVAPGIEIRYVILGAGPDTVLVPNAAGLADELRPLATRRTLVLYDPRGRGGSSPVTDTAALGLTHDLTDLEALRRHLRIARPTLLGHSYYGALVALYARDHPGRVGRLVMLGPLAPSESLWTARASRGAGVDSAGTRRVDSLRRAGVEQRDPAAFCREHQRSVELPPLMGRHGAIGRYRADPCVFANERPGRLYPMLGRVFSSLGRWDWSASVAAVDVPTLVVHGTDDPIPIEGGKAWVTSLPRARLVDVPGAGHLPWLESPDVVFAAIEAFLGER